MEQVDDLVMVLDTFLQIWKIAFLYVKYRKCMSTCGHCNMCTVLSEKCRQFCDRVGRQ